jgi:uncharacterized protein with von Willebrand factor type A (vWA) domain
VPTGSLVLFTEALGLLGLQEERQVYWAGRATLVRDPEDIATYDRIFASYWKDRMVTSRVEVLQVPQVTLAVDDSVDGPDSPGDGAAEDPEDVQLLRYSALEVLKSKDLSGLSADEWAEAARLISSLRVAAEVRPSRRTRTSRRASRGRPDLRATIRRNIRTGGVPMHRSWRRPVERPRRLVFLLDVSGSMESYARGLARLAHAAVSARRTGRVEVFTIGTRLTRVTRDLARRDPDAALQAASSAVADWSGGTRLGTTLRQFNDEWGVRGLARGAIVVICSDGWDRGDPELVGEEMARLHRVARRVVWVNPLKASPGYAPLARGMAAALPYVDQFVEGHSVSSLEHLAAVIARPGRQEVPV